MQTHQQAVLQPFSSPLHESLWAKELASVSSIQHGSSLDPSHILGFNKHLLNPNKLSRSPSGSRGSVMEKAHSQTGIMGSNLVSKVGEPKHLKLKTIISPLVSVFLHSEKACLGWPGVTWAINYSTHLEDLGFLLLELKIIRSVVVFLEGPPFPSPPSLYYRLCLP